MKIGIVTFQRSSNYGAQLQLFALYTTLREKYDSVEIVDHPYTYPWFPGKELMAASNDTERTRILNDYNTQNQKEIEAYRAQSKRFIDFHKRLGTTHPMPEFSPKLYNIMNQKDCLVFGSDQIWREKEPFYFGFQNHTRKITYAASFGSNKSIPLSYVHTFHEGLKSYDQISVREAETTDLINQLDPNFKAVTVLDPTFLIELKDFESIMEKPVTFPSGKYVLVYEIWKDKALHAKAQRLAEEKGLELFIIERAPREDLGPGEFLYLIQHATYFVTNSFHGVALSIIFGRNFTAIEPNNGAARIENLLGSVDLMNHYFPIHAPYEALNFEQTYNADLVRQKLLPLIEKSKAWLFSAVEPTQKKCDVQEETTPLTTFFEKITAQTTLDCTGCSACACVCPVQAITMTQNCEGFNVPKYHRELCIHCGKCATVCHMDHTTPSHAPLHTYAAWNNNADVRAKSASGGISDALMQTMLRENGNVVGVQYDSDFRAFHACAKTGEGVQKFMQSKYMESDPKTIYAEIKECLEGGQKVLFTGTPCQVAGLYQFLGGEHPQLITVDLICHGVPSPQLFQRYKSYVESLAESSLKSVSFRDKTASSDWQKFNVSLSFQNGICATHPYKEDLFFMTYLSNKGLRASCSNCSYAQKNRVSDITLGDFWGITTQHPEMCDIPKGISAITANTSKGADFLSKCDVQLKQTTFDAIAAGNPRLHVPGHHIADPHFYAVLNAIPFPDFYQYILRQKKIKYISLEEKVHFKDIITLAKMYINRKLLKKKTK